MPDRLFQRHNRIVAIAVLLGIAFAAGMSGIFIGAWLRSDQLCNSALQNRILIKKIVVLAQLQSSHPNNSFYLDSLKLVNEPVCGMKVPRVGDPER